MENGDASLGTITQDNLAASLINCIIGRMGKLVSTMILGSNPDATRFVKSSFAFLRLFTYTIYTANQTTPIQVRAISKRKKVTPKPITRNTLFYGDNLPIPSEAFVRLAWVTAACLPHSVSELGR